MEPFSLDVLEHISANQEDKFIENVAFSFKEFGTFIAGMPFLESQLHASALSKAGHINCKRQEDLGLLLEKHFHRVFTYGMNDEVLHT